MANDFDPTVLLDINVRSHLRRFDGTGLNSDKLAEVYYEVPLGAGTQCIEWLQENRKTIRDQNIDHQELKGRWRSANIQSEQSVTNKDRVTIVQTFKYGWIESLVSDSTVDWSEARYISRNGHKAGTEDGEFPVTEENNPQQYHLVFWEGIDPLKLDAVRGELRDMTAGSWEPNINGEDIGTGFHLLDVIAETNDDRDGDVSGKITALFAKPRFNLQTWESYGTAGESKIYYLNQVPLYLAQEIINSYNKRTGATASATAPNQRFLVNITVRDKPDPDSTDKYLSGTSCAYLVRTRFYSNVDSPIDADDNTMGVTYRSNFSFNRQDGSYSGVIEKRVRQTQKVGPYRTVNTHGEYVMATDYSGLHEVDGSFYEATATWDSETEDIDLSLSVSAVELPENTITKGSTWQVTQRTNDDCTYDVQIRETTNKDIADLEYVSADNYAAEDTTTEKYNQLAVPVVTATIGKVVRVGVRYNKETGHLDVESVEREAKNQTSTDTRDGHLSSSTTTKNTQAETAASRSAITGERVVVSNQETEYGKHQTSEMVETAIEVSTIDHSKNGLSEHSRSKKWNAEKVALAPTRVAGEAKQLAQVPTKYKDKWNVVEDTETSTPWDSGWFSWESANNTVLKRRWGNQDLSFADTVKADFDAADNNSIDVQYNRFGKWNGVATRRPIGGSGSDTTFWKSTSTETNTLAPLERRIKRWDSPSKAYNYVLQQKARDETYTRRIRQYYSDADTTKLAYYADLPANSEWRMVPRIRGVKDRGRIGYLVECSYITFGEWTDVAVVT